MKLAAGLLVGICCLSRLPFRPRVTRNNLVGLERLTDAQGGRSWIVERRPAEAARTDARRVPRRIRRRIHDGSGTDRVRGAQSVPARIHKRPKSPRCKSQKQARIESC